MVHGELAVSLARDADRVWEFGYVHSVAAVVPAARGDWEVADAHVRMATEAAQAFGAPGAIIAAATARAFLAMAWGDLEGAADAAAAVRGGRAEFLHNLGRDNWRSLEVEALIGLGRLGQAETALAELEAVLSPADPPSALVAAARLRGDLATAAGHHDAAAPAFQTAWRRAQGLRAPLALAQLEISDARRLRAVSQPQTAVARLRSARQRLITLGARPYLQACDRELAAAGAPPGPETAPAFVGLTPAEQAVARLVAIGHSKRQTAAGLYISVKTVESHLGTSSPNSASDLAQTSPPASALLDPSGPQPGSHLGSGPDDTASAAGDDDNMSSTSPIGLRGAARRGTRPTCSRAPTTSRSARPCTRPPLGRQSSAPGSPPACWPTSRATLQRQPRPDPCPGHSRVGEHAHEQRRTRS